MSNLLRRVGRAAAAMHPRNIAWQIRHARGPVHPIITPLGPSGRLKVRIYSSDVVGKSVYRHGVFEAAEVRLVTQFLKPGMIFVDAGANFGQYTILAAERVGLKGQVHSFEPSARMHGELCFNVALNGQERSCILNHSALSDKEGTARLSQYEQGAEVYGSLGDQHWAKSRITGYEDVSTTTLDAYIAKHRIERVDLIKMDIEGAELLALRGAERLLSRADAPAIVLEMADVNTQGFGYTALDTWNHLAAFRYRFYSFENGNGALAEATRPNNFLRGRNLLALKQSFDFDTL